MELCSCFILAFLERQLGNFSRNNLGTAANGAFNRLSSRRTAPDPVGAEGRILIGLTGEPIVQPPRSS